MALSIKSHWQIDLEHLDRTDLRIRIYDDNLTEVTAGITTGFTPLQLTDESLFFWSIGGIDGAYRPGKIVVDFEDDELITPLTLTTQSVRLFLELARARGL